MSRKNFQYLAKNVIPEKMASLLVGMPNSFKSWLLAILAIATANGDLLFDAFPCKRCDRIIYIDEDSPQYLYELRLEALGLGQIPTAIDQRCMQGFRLHNAQQRSDLIQEVSNMAQQGQTVLVLLDSLTKITAGWNMDRTDKASEAMAYIAQIRDAGATVVIAHHSSIHRKGKQPMNNTQILAGVDSTIYIEKIHIPNRSVFQVNPVAKRAPLTVSFAVELESNPDLEWAYMKKMGDTPVMPTGDEKLMFELFPDPAATWTVKEIAIATGRDLPDSRIRDALAQLCEQSCLKRISKPHDRSHAAFYQLHPDYTRLNTVYKKHIK